MQKHSRFLPSAGNYDSIMILGSPFLKAGRQTQYRAHIEKARNRRGACIYARASLQSLRRSRLWNRESRISCGRRWSTNRRSIRRTERGVIPRKNRPYKSHKLFPASVRRSFPRGRSQYQISSASILIGTYRAFNCPHKTSFARACR